MTDAEGALARQLAALALPSAWERTFARQMAAASELPGITLAEDQRQALWRLARRHRAALGVTDEWLQRVA